MCGGCGLLLPAILLVTTGITIGDTSLPETQCEESTTMLQTAVHSREESTDTVKAQFGAKTETSNSDKSVGHLGKMCETRSNQMQHAVRAAGLDGWLDNFHNFCWELIPVLGDVYAAMRFLARKFQNSEEFTRKFNTVEYAHFSENSDFDSVFEQSNSQAETSTKPLKLTTFQENSAMCFNHISNVLPVLYFSVLVLEGAAFVEEQKKIAIDATTPQSDVVVMDDKCDTEMERYTRDWAYAGLKVLVQCVRAHYKGCDIQKRAIEERHSLFVALTNVIANRIDKLEFTRGMHDNQLQTIEQAAYP